MDRPPSNTQQTLWHAGACLLILLACVLTPTLLTSCTSQSARSRQQGSIIPPDLSIALYIDGDPLSPDPVLHRSRYLLEPDRSLHIAVNQDATRHTYPPFVKFITLQQMHAIARLVEEHQLMYAPSVTEVTAETHTGSQPDQPRVTYQLNLEAWGRTHRFTTTLDASPGVRALLNALIAAGPVQPSGQVKPPAPTLLFHSPTPMETP